jgi:hypothetical protein
MHSGSPVRAARAGPGTPRRRTRPRSPVQRLTLHVGRCGGHGNEAYSPRAAAARAST